VINYADCRLAYVAVTAGKKIFRFQKNMLHDELTTPIISITSKHQTCLYETARTLPNLFLISFYSSEILDISTKYIQQKLPFIARIMLKYSIVKIPKPFQFICEIAKTIPVHM